MKKPRGGLGVVTRGGEIGRGRSGRGCEAGKTRATSVKGLGWREDHREVGERRQGGGGEKAEHN